MDLRACHQDPLAQMIGDIEFPDFTEEDRAMIIESMNLMKETLNEPLPRAIGNRKRPM